MSIDIFIRSYPRDYEILKYCLYSIKKYVTGYDKIIICVRQKDLECLKKQVNTEGLIIVTDHDFPDKIDYLGQQTTKLHADVWSSAEYICYIDSDCIFYDSVNLKDCYFENDNLILLMDLWKDVGDAICWKKCLNELNILTPYEFMRRLPQIYPSKILSKIRNLIAEKTGTDFLNGSIQVYKKCQFSEFNIMGSYMYLYDKNNINFKISKENTVKINMKQLWSHSNKKHLINEAMKVLNLNNKL